MDEILAAVRETLGEYGDEEATAEVLARASGLPFEDPMSFGLAVVAIAREVWQRKVELADRRAKTAEAVADGLAVMNLMPISKTVH